MVSTVTAGAAPAMPQQGRQGRLDQFTLWGGRCFVALVALDEATTALGLAHGLNESSGLYLAVAQVTHLSVGLLLLLTAAPKLLLAWGIARAWQWLLRQSGKRLDRVLVLGGLGLCCGLYACVIARNGLLLFHALR